MDNNSKTTNAFPYAQLSAAEVMQKIHSIPAIANSYNSLTPKHQQMFIRFCTGEDPFPITYDSFFKYVFHPHKHSKRLSRFLSAIIGCKVTVKEILPREHSVIDEFGHMVIMDIIVTLEDGTIVNVEIQKNPYKFPGERTSCYSADLIMREYQRINDECKNSADNHKFNYKDMKPVFTIVLLESSTSEFHKYSEHYIHHGKCCFDTGIELNMLQHFIYIPIDIFLSNTENKSTIDNELEAWLTLLGTQNFNRITALLDAYPDFFKIYQEINQLRTNIKEAFYMFSDELAILDRNTEEYMVDEMKKEIEEKDIVIAEKDSIITEKDNALIEKDNALIEKDRALSKKDNEIMLLKEQLAHFQKSNS